MKTNTFIAIFAVASIALFSFPAWGTDVGGIINTNTTWDLAGSPYTITDDVQIAYGITLQIDAGVEIIGNNGNIKVFGVLDAKGTENAKIKFDTVNIVPGNGPTNEWFKIKIDYVEASSGSIYYPTGYAIYGSISLRNSILTNMEYMYLWYPVEDSFIEKNIFIDSGGISIGHSNDIKVYIRNNAFYQYTDVYGEVYAIKNWASYDTSETIVEYNSFLSTDRVTLILPSGYDSTNMTAINNFWNTTDTAVIEAMIYDKNDDLSSAGYITYTPFLTVPDPDTPIPIIIMDELAVDFGTNGLWHYDGITWSKKTSWNPDGNMAGWVTLTNCLAVDFGTNGLWNYDGMAWRKKSSWNAGSGGMTGWTGGLAVDFDGNGLWNYNGTTWSKKTSWNPDNDLVGWSGGLAVDFGTNGLWNYDGTTWGKKTSWNPGSGGMAAWIGGLAVDFDSNGLWNFNGSTWTKKTSWDPGSGGLCGWAGGLAVDFDGNGLWNYNGTTWSKKTSWDPGSMCPLGSGLVVNFGVNGVWYYDGFVWSKKTNWNAENLTDVDLY